MSAVTFDPASVALVPLDGRAACLAELSALCLSYHAGEYTGGDCVRGTYEGGEVLGKQPDGSYVYRLGNEWDAFEFRAEADRILASHGLLDGGTDLDFDYRLDRYDVRVVLDESVAGVALGLCLVCDELPALPGREQCSACATCECGDGLTVSDGHERCEACELADIEREAVRIAYDEHCGHPVEHRRAMARALRDER